MRVPTRVTWAAALAAAVGLTANLVAQPPDKAGKAAKKASKAADPNDKSGVFPPALPDGKAVVTDTSDEFLKPPTTLKEGVAVAKAAPTVDFLYFPGQTYPGKPWSNWGDGVAANGKYYSAVGDHLAPGGNAFVFEYDPVKKSLRQVFEVRKTLNLPDGHYTPGKIHTRVDLGSDGWLYFATHRGSEAVTTSQYHYKGDWIFRCHPETGKSEVVAAAPVPQHAIPNGLLDPDRLIYYGGTAIGRDAKAAAGKGEKAEDIRFFAYDVKNHKMLYAGPGGPARYMILARSTGRVYFVPGAGDSPLMRFDPAKGGPPEKVAGAIGIRAATEETPQGVVYTASLGQGGREASIYAFDARTEEIQNLGPAAVASNTYIGAIDADPTGRYLYYVPGAHGGSERDGSAVVQFDTKTRTKKVIAFLHPFYQQKYGLVPAGTYSVAVDPKGDTVYVTWNVNRGGRAWDSCGLTAIHVPASERVP